MAVAVTFNKRVPQGRATLSELMARQKAAVAGQASSQGIETPTIMQGLGKLGMIGADVFKERRAARDEAAGREDLAKIMTGIGAEGATPEQEAAAYLIDPEMAQRLREERLSYAQQLAERQQAVADREDTQLHAVGMQNDQQVAAEGLQTGRQTFESGQNQAQRDLTASEGAAGRTVQTSEGQANRTASMAEQMAAQAFQTEEAKRKEGLPESPSAIILKDWFGGNYHGREQDFINDLKKAQAVTGGDTINVGGETDPFFKKLDEASGETWGAMEKGGPTAAAALGDISVMRELIKIAPQGPVPGFIAEKIGNYSTAGAALSAIIERIKPTLHVEGTGATSDLEYAGFAKSLPSLKNRPEANAMILDVMQQKAEIQRDIAIIASQVANRQKTRAEGSAALQAVYGRHLNIPEDLQKMIVDAEGQGGAPGVTGNVSIEDADYSVEEIEAEKARRRALQGGG